MAYYFINAMFSAKIALTETTRTLPFIGGKRDIIGEKMPKLDHIALEVSNLERAIEFYTEKMGFVLRSRSTNEEQQEEYCFLKSEGTTLELITDLKKSYRPKQKFQRPYCPHICFATDDMEKTIKELHAKNVEIIRGPLEIEGEETWVYFSDPDGNVLEYIEWYK